MPKTSNGHLTRGALATLFTALMLLPAAASARQAAVAPATIGDPEIARLMRFRIERQHRAPAAVIGVLRPAGREVLAFGRTSLNSRRAVDGASVFEVASLTKVFTALILADAAVRGELGLDDALCAYVPHGVEVPQFGARLITLKDLATHTSGLPLRPNNIPGAPDALNKYAGYTLEQLYSGLPNYPLNREPGAQFEYSNVGFALLGQALAHRLRAGYPALLSERVTGPLGLDDTALEVASQARRRLAQGYDADLKPVAPIDYGALGPAAGLRSTANDLLRFLALFLQGAGPDELPEAARLMLSVDRPGEADGTRMALGWRRTTVHGETYYWSNGSADGSRTFMGFNPARGVAVVVLANAASGEGFDDIARRVLDPAQEVDLRIPTVHHQISLPGAALDRVVGVYEYAPGDRFEITRGATGLIVGAGPGQQLVIYPESPTRFFAKAAELQFDFVIGGAGPARAMVLHQDGQSYTYNRIP